ncbi:MAG TPA: YciI-like protein [Candidatus Angelobacter sp.]|nr:YciI-like protein [Candidatus Angelobacter sp.]
MHFILMYQVDDNYVERREEFRELHLKYAQAAYDRGELVLAGALAEPVTGAMLVFRGPTEETAETFAKNDPYVINGLVRQWKVRKWNTVIGDGAKAG